MKTIYIPVLGASPVCPVAAVQVMFSHIPTHKNQPLFLLSTSPNTPLTDSVARKRLKKVSLALDINPSLDIPWF